MHNKQGFATIAVVIVVALVVIGGLVYMFSSRQAPPTQTVQGNPIASSSSSTTNQPAPETPHILSLPASSGRVGGGVYIVGSGLDKATTVYFNGYVVPTQNNNCYAVTRTDGKGIVLTVPYVLNNYCHRNTSTGFPDYVGQLVSPGVYNVQVRNAGGESNVVSFTVVASDKTPTPSISSLSPSSGPAGTAVTIKGSNFDRSDYRVFFGSRNFPMDASYLSSTEIHFVIPSTFPRSDCVPMGKGTTCPDDSASVVSGAYYVQVGRGNDSSSPVPFTVTK
jgi:hypothetical protein